MKIRTDFVTNSSSSSFVIVGINDNSIIKELIKAEGKTEISCDYGIDQGKIVDFYGYYDEADYAGINIENLMETMTLPQLKQYFVDIIKKEYNIDIPLNRVELHYGEVGE